MGTETASEQSFAPSVFAAVAAKRERLRESECLTELSPGNSTEFRKTAGPRLRDPASGRGGELTQPRAAF